MSPGMWITIAAFSRRTRQRLCPTKGAAINRPNGSSVLATVLATAILQIQPRQYRLAKLPDPESGPIRALAWN